MRILQMFLVLVALVYMLNVSCAQDAMSTTNNAPQIATSKSSSSDGSESSESSSRDSDSNDYPSTATSNSQSAESTETAATDIQSEDSEGSESSTGNSDSNDYPTTTTTSNSEATLTVATDNQSNGSNDSGNSEDSENSEESENSTESNASSVNSDSDEDPSTTSSNSEATEATDNQTYQSTPSNDSPHSEGAEESNSSSGNSDSNESPSSTASNTLGSTTTQSVSVSAQPFSGVDVDESECSENDPPCFCSRTATSCSDSSYCDWDGNECKARAEAQSGAFGFETEAQTTNSIVLIVVFGILVFAVICGTMMYFSCCRNKDDNKYKYDVQKVATVESETDVATPTAGTTVDFYGEVNQNVDEFENMEAGVGNFETQQIHPQNGETIIVAESDEDDLFFKHTNAGVGDDCAALNLLVEGTEEDGVNNTGYND